MASPLTFDSSNEPYLGRHSVFVFDKMISATLAVNQPIADVTHKGGLTPLQLAATEIIPHGLSMALSIRELVRQGYLLSGEVLMRPLMERAAVISYLHDHPEKVSLWAEGWPYKSRPALKVMLASMGRGYPGPEKIEEIAAQIVREHNVLIHADPQGAKQHAAQIGGRLAYSPSKSLNEPERCDYLALQASCWLAIITSRACAIFPNAEPQKDSSK